VNDRDRLVRQLRSEIADRLHEAVTTATSGGRELASDDQRMLARRLLNDAFRNRAAAAVGSGEEPLGADEEEAIARAVLDLLFGLGPLSRILDVETVENVEANGPHTVFITHADGRVEEGPPLFDSVEEMLEMLRAVARRAGLNERLFDAAHPFLTMELPDGSRLHAVQAVTGEPCISVRRHRYTKVTLGDLVGLGMVDEVLQEFLAASVRARLNIVVCGGTNAGKTTLLRALVNEIPASERLVTIEKGFELGIDRHAHDLHPNVVAMEAREANVEGEGEITMRALVREALRMNPSRVLVGEVLGDELLPMLNAMTQGNDGSMCTIHAHSSESAFNRFVQYAVQSPERLTTEATNVLVANAVDLVVFVDQQDPSLGSGRQRYASSVREVVGADGAMVMSNEVFAPDFDGRARPAAPMSDRRMDRLVAAGFDRSLLARREQWAAR
jgi:pilus assembly protein CpaF